MPERAQPRHGDDVRLVAEPVHGLRAPLHVLLRPRVRAARRPAVRTSATAARSGSRSNIAEVLRAELARPTWKREGIAIGAATDPVPAGRGPLPADARVHRGRSARRAARSRSSRAARMIVRDVDVLVEAARRAKVHVTFSIPTLDDEVWRTTEPGTAPPAPATARAARARRRGDRRRRRHGADPPGALGPPGAAARGRRGGARGGRDGSLGEPALPEAGHEGALPRGARRGLARAARALRAPLRRRAYLPAKRRSTPVREQVRGSRRAARRPRPAPGRAGAAASRSPLSSRLAV